MPALWKRSPRSSRIWAMSCLQGGGRSSRMRLPRGLMDLSSDTSRFWRDRILITVKTYPTPHPTHHEAVCTAGINAAGKWRRLWPIPFRYLEKGRQSRRYEWIDVALRKQSGDLRPESHVVDPDTIVRDGFVDARRHWGARRAMVDSWCLQGTRGRGATYCPGIDPDCPE